MQTLAARKWSPPEFTANANLLLGRLPQEFIEAVRPRMAAVSLSRGDVLCRSGDVLGAAYFPCSGVVSAALEATLGAADACLMGREGLVAPSAILDAVCPYTLTARTPGFGIAIESEFLRAVISRDREAEHAFHQFHHVLTLQAACLAVANVNERLEARVARWLLMCEDRLGPRLPILHSDISQSLGVRRAGVTLAIHVLEGEQAIRARRACIEVLDRDKLRRRAGPTYGIAEREYVRLFGCGNFADGNSVRGRTVRFDAPTSGTFHSIIGYGWRALRESVAGPFQTRRRNMSDSSLKDLLAHGLKDMHYAENAILKALPKMIEAAESPKLKEALSKHRAETSGHVDRLEQAFRAIDMRTASTPCEAMKGILKEGDEVVEKFGSSPAADAAIIFACQAVEHYEISRYGTLREWADSLGLKDVSSILSQTLEEEYAADDKLTALAKQGANAAGAGGSRSAHAR